MAKNTTVIEIHRQLTEVYGSDIMSVQIVNKWCREFHERRHKVHDESRIGHLKAVTAKSVNTIRAPLNKDHRLTLWELETIMNDDNDEEIKTFV